MNNPRPAYYTFVKPASNDQARYLVFLLGSHAFSGLSFDDMDKPPTGMWFEEGHEDEEHEKQCIEYCITQGLLPLLG